MSFTEEAEHIRMLRDTISRFAELEMAPDKMRQWDAEHRFPRDVFSRLAELGVCGLTVDEDYGGMGRDIVAAIAVIDELAKAGGLYGPYIHCAFYGGINISEKGTNEQKAALLPKLAAGEIFFAYGLSEPNIGADLANVSTSAALSADGSTVTINGAKRWCTMADEAEYIYCLVKSDKEAPKYQNLSFVLIPHGTPGVTVEKIPHIGLDYANTCDVTFYNVEIPAENIVGGREAWNKGWPMLAGPALDVEKLEVAAYAYGLARRVVDLTWNYAGEREQFGKPIARHQAVAHTLADAKTRLLACKHMLYYAASLADRAEPCTVETSMAKLFVTDTAAQIGLACQQVYGAYGFADEYDIARYVNGLLLTQTIGGSSNIQRNNIANRLGLGK